ncbi:Similar to S.cerevisiae protein CMC1 (Copper-binding protein of the mitochondrial intermembrane space) [Malassezia sympodialis ATCC 42132]|uniref:COX assembly mitochondrial protein n=1 Tax=Malassezia sympodialis (strain ATCC 42132) TaxID=1230383 RepID=A0A1M8AAN6_MALS4|nr:Similar to S.cerevisiae protein CMC1 (Copper-binding protein of the mitochondrial intermembrane space) [Malassezia sympodialis ATCC 42132]
MSNTSRVMSNREYEKFMKEKKHEAFKKCDPIVQEFVECSRNRLFSVAWACRKQNRAMYECLLQYMNDNTMLEAEQAYLDQHRNKP